MIFHNFSGRNNSPLQVIFRTIFQPKLFLKCWNGKSEFQNLRECFKKRLPSAFVKRKAAKLMEFFRFWHKPFMMPNIFSPYRLLFSIHHQKWTAACFV